MEAGGLTIRFIRMDLSLTQFQLQQFPHIPLHAAAVSLPAVSILRHSGRAYGILPCEDGQRNQHFSRNPGQPVRISTKQERTGRKQRKNRVPQKPRNPVIPSVLWCPKRCRPVAVAPQQVPKVSRRTERVKAFGAVQK